MKKTQLSSSEPWQACEMAFVGEFRLESPRI